ncbi:MAG: hypothetical protein GY854_21660 [Deltaproteobacteria bacterium]|nr:hypothetical protein [Deltaproteobacteria bacterium]
MLSDTIQAEVRKINIKREPLAKGGDLTVDLSIRGPLNDQIAASLGADVAALIETRRAIPGSSRLPFRSIDLDMEMMGLSINIWRSVETDSDPFVTLQGVDTKRIQLVKDKESSEPCLGLVLALPPMNNENLNRVISCLGYDVTLSMSYQQGDLGLES